MTDSIKRFPRPEFSLFVTTAPFEVDESNLEFGGFIHVVDSDTYEECGVDEQFSYYIAKTEPKFNFDEYEFEIAETDDWYEDDYTRVEVSEEEILFIVKNSFHY